MITKFNDFILESAVDLLPSKDKLAEFYALKKQLDNLNNQIQALAEESSEMDLALKPMFDYMKETKERMVQTDGFILTIQKYGGTQTNNSYKNAWDLALTKVNTATKKVLESCLESTKKITNVKHSYSIGKVQESIISTLYNKVSSIVKSLMSKMKSYFSDIDSGNSEMEEIINILLNKILK